MICLESFSTSSVLIEDERSNLFHFPPPVRLTLAFGLAS